MHRLAHAPGPSVTSLVSLHYCTHDPITSYHHTPRNLEQRPEVSRAAAIFDVILKRLAMYCKHPMYMRANQRNHFRPWQRGRVPDLVVLPQSVHPFPDPEWRQLIHCRHYIPPVKYREFIASTHRAQRFTLPRTPAYLPREALTCCTQHRVYHTQACCPCAR